MFSPEHGLDSTADDWVGDGVDTQTGLQVTSLYNPGQSAPYAAVFENIDAIVIDLQDVGARYYSLWGAVRSTMRPFV